MNICLCSAFRDSGPYIQRYFEQITALGAALFDRGDRLALVWGEGDSADHTLAHLSMAAAAIGYPVDLVNCTHGGGHYGSVVREERFRQLAHVGRVIFRAIPAHADVVVYVEADLIWQPVTIQRMIDRVFGQREGGRSMFPLNYTVECFNVDVIAPPILLDRPGWGTGINFYDTFCYRRNGQRFEHRPPYHPDNDGASLLELDTAGSCLAMSGEHARSIKFDERVLMGVCEQIRAKGGHVWFDPTLPPCLHQ